MAHALLQPSWTLCVYGGTAVDVQCLHLSESFLPARRSKRGNSYGNVAGGLLAGCLSQPVLYQND